MHERTGQLLVLVFDRSLCNFDQDSAAIQTNGQCRHCNGDIYEHGHDVVCTNCGTVIGDTTRDWSYLTSPWTSFHEKRGSYDKSGRRRCAGGYPHAYEWGDDEDPQSFYR